MVDFITIYSSEPCLWQIKFDDYHNCARKDVRTNEDERVGSVLTTADIVYRTSDFNLLSSSIR